MLLEVRFSETYQWIKNSDLSSKLESVVIVSTTSSAHLNRRKFKRVVMIKLVVKAFLDRWANLSTSY